jgi:Co/Zn/Cd efflux system component
MTTRLQNDSVVPSAEVMGVIGVLAIVANGVYLALLWRHRAEDINMRSAWLCSLNDVGGNAAVLVASAAVTVTGSGWPDIVVGLMIAVMFGASAASLIKSATQKLRAEHKEPAVPAHSHN